MARKTDGEKIDELDKVVAALTERLDNTVKEANNLYEAHTETARVVNDLRREFEREIALLKREVEELKKGQERWGQRLWMVLAPLVAGLLGALLYSQLGVKK